MWNRLMCRIYGTCEKEGCDHSQLSNIFVGLGYCWEHYHEAQDAAYELGREAEFNRKADIIAEGIRRSRN